MEIKVQSIKFDADQKLLDFIDNQVGKIAKYYEDIVRTEVNLSLLADPQNKNVKIIVTFRVRNYCRKNADTFEEAIVDCVGVLKELLFPLRRNDLK